MMGIVAYKDVKGTYASADNFDPHKNCFGKPRSKSVTASVTFIYGPALSLGTNAAISGLHP